MSSYSQAVKGWLRHRALAYLERREHRRDDRSRIVWILGHMRSGSTLLMHLLSSHPEVLGAGERNAVYASPQDLRRLAVEAAYARRRFFREYRYVVDQINHDRFLVDEGLLDHPRVAKIFLVREPRGAVASMVEVLGRHYGMTLEQAADYYVDRLRALERYARKVADQRCSLFLSYQDLVKNPRPSLDRLQAFLDLETPLSESYRRFRFTGRQGDPSRRISSGRILTDLQPRPVDLEPAVLERARQAYSRCLSTLAEHCGHCR